jgi:sulfur-carrier protein
MATVELTKHLYTFFPALEGRELVVEAATVADVVRELDRLAPGLAFYVCERGRLRMHVNIFVGDERIADRHRLSDPIAPDARVFILQALSGGSAPNAEGGLR